MIGDEEEEDLFADLDSERKQKKQGKKQKKEKKMTEEDEKKKAELELLMIDEVKDNSYVEQQGNELKHNYDMNEIKKSIKQKEKKSKKRGQEEVKDDFEVIPVVICYYRLILKMIVLRVWLPIQTSVLMLRILCM